ncbi:MAG TPA: PPOX class F420-dependent oxidoreductase [Candidatus Limnocylindrales bacterium]
MTAQAQSIDAIAAADPRRAARPASDAAALAGARFIDLVTFRRDGTPVGTPVLFVADAGRLLVRTASDAGKLKRLAHTAIVEIAPSDSRGRRLGAAAPGTARVLGPGALAPMLARLHARYRIAGPVATLVRRLRGQQDVVIEITLDAPGLLRPSLEPSAQVPQPAILAS